MLCRNCKSVKDYMQYMSASTSLAGHPELLMLCRNCKSVKDYMQYMSASTSLAGHPELLMLSLLLELPIHVYQHSKADLPGKQLQTICLTARIGNEYLTHETRLLCVLFHKEHFCAINAIMRTDSETLRVNFELPIQTWCQTASRGGMLLGKELPDPATHFPNALKACGNGVKGVATFWPSTKTPT